MHPAKTYVLFMSLIGLGFGLHAATYVPLLLENGMDLSDVALINLFFWASVSLAELPTGMWADGKSRSLSVRTGAAIFCLGTLGYSTATTIGAAIFWESFIGIGYACTSGAQQAWLTDALIARGESGRVGRVFGEASAGKAAGFIVGGIASALIGTIDLRLGWVSSSGAMFVSYLVSKRMMREEGEPAVRVSEVTAFRMSWDALRSKSGLMWGAVSSAVFGLVLPFNHYWSPFFRERVGQVGLAWVWPIIYGSLAASGWLIRKWGTGTGEYGPISLALFCAGAGLALVGLPDGAFGPIAFVIAHEMGRGFFEPLLDAFTQRKVGSAYRATYGSFQSLIGRAGFALVLAGVWFLTRGMPTTDAAVARVWLVAGSLLAMAAAVLWLCRPDGDPD